MAQDQNNTPSGGNKPKPKPGNSPGGQSAKDQSRAQSRPVSGNAPTSKAGKGSGAGGRGGNTPRPGRAPAAAPEPRRLSGAMMAWGAVGLVVVVIAVLVIVKLTAGSTNNANAPYTPVTPAPASVVHDVANIPLSVYNTVGVTSPTVQVTPPIVISGQPPMTLNGQSPAMFYYGAEYCPYCAAERWAMTAALSRFGTWSGLKVTASSHTDVYPATNTFSYYGASLTSPYLEFGSVEAVSNVPTTSYYKPLQNPTKEEQDILAKYDSPQFIPGATAGQIGFPFININNLALISGPSYSPGVLSGLSWTDIAGGLDDPTSAVTQAIVATANYITAVICASTKDAPSSVCTSSGVEAAAKALKLS
ncbi:MAG: DUF929 family protein [Acidimicrobiales bacterium]